MNIKKIISILKKEYPQSKTALHYRSPLEMLVATILSAQCTDKRVNEVTKKLFKEYRTLDDYADAEVKKFEAAIRPTGFFRNKARNIINAAKKISNDFGGTVPGKMEELITLPGVARKTASVVQFNVFGFCEGIAVDTHVKRLCIRLQISVYSDPVRIERELMVLLPKKEWGPISNLLIDHGRNICRARNPQCAACVLQKICPSSGKCKT